MVDPWFTGVQRPILLNILRPLNSSHCYKKNFRAPNPEAKNNSTSPSRTRIRSNALEFYIDAGWYMQFIINIHDYYQALHQLTYSLLKHKKLWDTNSHGTRYNIWTQLVLSASKHPPFLKSFLMSVFYIYAAWRSLSSKYYEKSQFFKPKIHTSAGNEIVNTSDRNPPSAGLSQDPKKDKKKWFSVSKSNTFCTATNISSQSQFVAVDPQKQCPMQNIGFWWTRYPDSS